METKDGVVKASEAELSRARVGLLINGSAEAAQRLEKNSTERSLSLPELEMVLAGHIALLGSTSHRPITEFFNRAEVEAVITTASQALHGATSSR